MNAAFFTPQFSPHLDQLAGKSYEEYMEREKENFEILLEDIQGHVKQVLEATDDHTTQLQRLEGAVGEVQETIGQVKDDVAAIKVALVDLVGLRQAISDLKKRVEGLEAKAG